MPVRIFGLFGQHHGLELELREKKLKSIREKVFFDYNNRCYEIQSFSLTGKSANSFFCELKPFSDLCKKVLLFDLIL